MEAKLASMATQSAAPVARKLDVRLAVAEAAAPSLRRASSFQAILDAAQIVESRATVTVVPAVAVMPPPEARQYTFADGVTKPLVDARSGAKLSERQRMEASRLQVCLSLSLCLESGTLMC
jgi:hypothetical protein